MFGSQWKVVTVSIVYTAVHVHMYIYIHARDVYYTCAGVEIRIPVMHITKDDLTYRFDKWTKRTELADGPSENLAILIIPTWKLVAQIVLKIIGGFYNTFHNV